MRGVFVKKITVMKLAEIKAFKNTDFFDFSESTDVQLAQMKPFHLRKENSKKIMEEFKI